MFAPSHMAVGALAQAALRRRWETALVALLSHAIMDSPRLWHPYPWPPDSPAPAIIKVLPYPHDLPSALVVVALVALTIAVPFLLRRYWWGMLWGIAPDVVDYLVLRPIIGRTPIHNLFLRLSTPWEFGVEVLLIALIVWGLLRRRGPRGRLET